MQWKGRDGGATAMATFCLTEIKTTLAEDVVYHNLQQDLAMSFHLVGRAIFGRRGTALSLQAA